MKKPNGVSDEIDLPKGWRAIQWQVENADDLAVFLEDYDVRMRRMPGDGMLIQGRHKGMSIQLMPGCCLVIRPAEDDSGEQLGVIHGPNYAEYVESETLHLVN